MALAGAIVIITTSLAAPTIRTEAASLPGGGTLYGLPCFPR